ncbi:MAG: hypothetical protein B6245_13820 [Desulfobacteraceae bacterium 4572_88]|nr:MAG: hypothetical protein B6245_13820 [Desulfobacteraceae bacterium 4572_88]
MQLSNLINTHSPEDVLDEVRIILDLISPEFHTRQIISAFETVIRLYKGDYPGYRACNTEYHDLRHVTDVFLAMARLIHGASLDGGDFIGNQISVALMAALFHDVGYLQEKWDTQGTGAKYSLSSVRRSADFFRRYGKTNGLSYEDTEMGCSMISCTKIASNLPRRKASYSMNEILGNMLCVADLLAQMSDRTYLEKLLYLYQEVNECGLGICFESEVDLLRKALDFYEFTEHYIQMRLHENERFMKLHFGSRWDIHQNLYRKAIEKQKRYLYEILDKPDDDPRQYLKRSGIVDHIRERYEQQQ